MNNIGVEVNSTELENVQNIDVHCWKYNVFLKRCWKYNVNYSILDGKNVLVGGIYKEFFVVFMLLSCCCLIIICMIS